MYPRPGRFDLVLHVLRDSLIPAAEKQPGYSGMVILNNREANRIVAITMWESEAELLASTNLPYFQEQMSYMIVHLLRPPEFENYEFEAM
jgi:heme-degrading monooxygenase HmoA